MGYDPTGEYCVANKDGTDTNYLDDWIIEGAGAGGYGGTGNYFGYGTSYYSYTIRNYSSATNNPRYYNVTGAVSVTDGMAVTQLRQYTITNPWGKKGGPAHQDTIKSLQAEYESNGYLVGLEVRVDTAGGYKPYRYADLSVTNTTTGETFYINVGKQLKSGIPCARERYAMLDFQTHGYIIFFVAYN